jgi:hypothetical protein
MTLLDGGTPGYYSQAGDSWSPITVESYDDATKTDILRISSDSKFVATTKTKTSSKWPLYITLLFIVIAGPLGVIWFIGWRQRSQMKSQYEDYLHKSRGY